MEDVLQLDAPHRGGSAVGGVKRKRPDDDRGRSGDRREYGRHSDRSESRGHHGDRGSSKGGSARGHSSSGSGGSRKPTGDFRSHRGGDTGRRHADDDREEDLGVKPVLDVSKFERGAAVDVKAVEDLKTKSLLKRKEKQARIAAESAAHAELLLTEEAGFLEGEGMERTYRFKQKDVAAAADVGVARKAVDLSLPTYGPYTTRYSRSGRHMLLAGEKGHVAIIDWNTSRLTTEFHVKESTYDACFLHNQTMFAVAQKKYAYIYDNTGMELHCLRNHVEPLALDFLPYHFLLVSSGRTGYLKYQDVSTGALVAEHRTKLGPCGVMRQNPWNGVICCGHSNGSVTMWTPNVTTPVVKLLAHRGPINALAVDTGGTYMVTAGMDARVKVWDIRKFGDDPVANYFVPTPARTVDVSQRGLVAVGFGSHVQIWGRDFALEGGARGAGGSGAGFLPAASVARAASHDVGYARSSSSSAGAASLAPVSALASSLIAGKRADDDAAAAAAAAAGVTPAFKPGAGGIVRLIGERAVYKPTAALPFNLTAGAPKPTASSSRAGAAAAPADTDGDDVDEDDDGLVAASSRRAVRAAGGDDGDDDDDCAAPTGSAAKRPRRSSSAAAADADDDDDDGDDDDEGAAEDDGADHAASGERELLKAAAAVGGGSKHVMFAVDDEEEEAAGAGGAAAAAAAGGAGTGEADGAAGAGFRPHSGRGGAKAKGPYMRHELPGNPVKTLRFRPYDDFLAIGHANGISTIIVPGAGEPNYDSREADPFQTKTARKEHEVHALLDKLAPTTITLDPSIIGSVDMAPAAVKAREAKAEAASRDAAAAAAAKEAALNPSKGKGKAEKRRAKKNANVITEQRQAMRDKNAADKVAAQERAAEEDARRREEADGAPSSALSRFYGKRS